MFELELGIGKQFKHSLIQAFKHSDIQTLLPESPSVLNCK